MSPQFLALLPFLSISPAGAQPSLVFSRDDVPALQQRIAAPASAAWAEVKARADAYCDRASGQYADPGSLDAMPSGEIRYQVLGHTFGRKLTAIGIQAKEMMLMRERLNKLFAEATGQPIKKIEKDTDRDFWLSGREAIDYGLATHMITSMSELK